MLDLVCFENAVDHGIVVQKFNDESLTLLVRWAGLISGF